MSGTNIKVAIRVRPLIASELQKKLKPQWSFKDNHIYQINSDNEIIGEPYSFDHIFPSDKSNKDIYNILVDPFIDETLNGVNSTIFAYGQTSSGKTYTMLGNDTDSGILSLAIEKIFNSIDDCINRKFLLRISYIEIYNEKFIDLLSSNKHQKELKIRESFNGQICLQGVTEEFVSKREEVFDLIKLGNKNRHIAGTNMNERSSRSHTIFRIMIESTKIHDFDSKEHPLQISNLNFVDLAGSERVAQTKATGVRLKEGNYINKSLSSLSLVIKQLSDGNDFVNFRDSKLTRLLQDSLGGNSNTLIITTITTTSIEDTLSTLNFAQRAKTVRNKPIINEIVSKQTTSKRYEELIRQLTEQLNEQMSKNKNLEVENDEISEHISHLQKQLNMLNNFQKNVADFNETDMNLPKRRHTIGFLQTPQQQQRLQEFDDERDLSFLTASTKTTMISCLKDESDSEPTNDVDNDNNGDVNNKSTLSTPKHAIKSRLLFLQQDFDVLTGLTRHEQNIINELSYKVTSLEAQLSETKDNEQKQLEIIDKLKNDVISIKRQQQEESDILIEQMRNKFILREKELLEKITSLEDQLKEENFNKPDDNIFNDCDRKDILNQLYQLEEILICYNKSTDKQEEQMQKEEEILNNFQRKIEQYLGEIQSKIFNKIDKTGIIVNNKDFDKLKTSILEYFNGDHDVIQNISILENLLVINEDLSTKSNTIQKLIEENLQLNYELNKSKEQLIEYRNDNSELQQQLNNAHVNYDDLKFNNDLVKNQFIDMANEIDCLKKEIDKLNNQIMDFKSVINTFELEKLDLVNSYKNQISELEKKNALELRTYQEQIVEFNEQRNSQMVEFKNIELENQDLYKNLHKQTVLVDDKNNEIDSLNNEITTLKTIISKLEIENKNYREQLTDYNQLTESVNSYKLQIESLNDKLAQNKAVLPSTSSSSSTTTTTNSHSKLQECVERYQRTIGELCRLNLSYIRSILVLSHTNTDNEVLQNPKIHNYFRELYNNSCSLRDKCDLLRTQKPSNIDLYETVEIIRKSLNLFQQYNNDSFDLWKLKITNLEQHYKKLINDQKTNCKQCMEYQVTNEEYVKLQNKYFKMFMAECDKNSELREKIKSKDEYIQQLKNELWSIKNMNHHQSSTTRKPITKDCETECNIISMEMLETLTIKYEQAKGIARIRQQSINELMKQMDNNK